MTIMLRHVNTTAIFALRCWWFLMELALISKVAFPLRSLYIVNMLTLSQYLHLKVQLMPRTTATSEVSIKDQWTSRSNNQ